MSEKIQKFNKFISENLNKNQLNAVQEKNGVFLVIAGAGSGKTRVITARISNLIINEDVNPGNIVALTFTNKAAKEMKDRIHSWIGYENQIPFIGTFHSYCLKLLKSNSHLLEFPQFSILDDDDQQKMLNKIIQRFALNKKLNTRQLTYNISSIKNNLAVDQPGFGDNKLIQEIYLAYETEKKASKCFDFDDLIVETIKLFRKNKNFKENFQRQVQHVLIDEYQDTSNVQHALLKQMAQDNNHKLSAQSLCVVGDEDQSIYSWRGATVDNIVNFTKDFPQAKVVKIEQNYRSVQPILEIANTIISNNKNRNPKKLWSTKEAKNRILHVGCMSEYKEGEMIAQAIHHIAKEKKINSIGILYRTHFQSRAIEEALIKQSIGYVIIGGIQFYERKEIKDLLAYLKLAVNPFDRVSFFRVVNCPGRKLGEKFEEEFYEHWNNEPFLNFTEIAKKLIEQKTLTKIKEESLTSFIEIFTKINRNSLPAETINYIISSTNYYGYLKNNFDEKESESKIENVKEFLRAAHHFEEQGINSIAAFLDEIALFQQKIVEEKKEESNQVQLMTLHAAKGLEFDTVIIAGLEEGIIPSSRALMQDDDLEEERRLFYVGITRAKEYLIFSNVQYRNTYGQTNTQAQSRFLDEIPTHLVYKEDSSNYYSSQQFSILFSQFFGNKHTTAKSSVFTFKDNIIPAKKDNLTDSGKWKQNQPVKHKQFGIGIVQKVETKSDGKMFISVKFRNEVKKINSDFLDKI